MRSFVCYALRLFLLPLKEETGQFFKKRFTRVLVPFIIWCILYAVYLAFRGNTGWYSAVVNILHIPVNFGTEVGHLWFVYMLMALYLVSPIISPWLAGASRRGMEYFLIIWVFTLCVPYIHLVFPKLLGECTWNNTPLFYYFSGFLGYMVLAVYIKKFLSKKKAWEIPVGLLLIIVGYLITACGFISLLKTKYAADLELTWGFETINVGMMSFGIFLLFKNVKSSNAATAAAKRITDISKLSYGIYLLHIMILNIFFDLLNPVIPLVQLKIPVIAVCTFICSYLIVKVISLLPKSKYILG